MGPGRLQESRQAGRRALSRLPETDDQTRKGTRRMENRRTRGRGNHRGSTSYGTRGCRYCPVSARAGPSRGGVAEAQGRSFCPRPRRAWQSAGRLSSFPDAFFVDGRVLAQLKRDDESKARFEQFVKMRTATDDPDRQRALRYISRPELARARMVPPFSI